MSATEAPVTLMNGHTTVFGLWREGGRVRRGGGTRGQNHPLKEADSFSFAHCCPLEGCVAAIGWHLTRGAQEARAECGVGRSPEDGARCRRASGGVSSRDGNRDWW